MRAAEDIVKRMLRTEKATRLEVDGKYFFKVASSANKIEIKSAVEELYGVEVDSVNVMNVRGKKKRVRYQQGMTSGWKKAVVTLKANNRIEVM